MDGDGLEKRIEKVMNRLEDSKFIIGMKSRAKELYERAEKTSDSTIKKKLLDRVAELDPSFRDGLLERARILEEEGDFEGARLDYETIRHFFPRDREATDALENIRSSGTKEGVIFTGRKRGLPGLFAFDGSEILEVDSPVTWSEIFATPEIIVTYGDGRINDVMTGSLVYEAGESNNRTFNRIDSIVCFGNKLVHVESEVLPWGEKFPPTGRYFSRVLNTASGDIIANSERRVRELHVQDDQLYDIRGDWDVYLTLEERKVSGDLPEITRLATHKDKLLGATEEGVYDILNKEKLEPQKNLPQHRSFQTQGFSIHDGKLYDYGSIISDTNSVGYIKETLTGETHTRKSGVHGIFSIDDRLFDLNVNQETYYNVGSLELKDKTLVSRIRDFETGEVVELLNTGLYSPQKVGGYFWGLIQDRSTVCKELNHDG